MRFQIKTQRGKGAVILCNFLSNALARYVAGELHSVTRIVSQVLLLRGTFHEVAELSSTYRKRQQLATSLHSVFLLVSKERIRTSS